MTPNTLNYMIAGYVVVLTGIGGYLFSLVFRSANVRRQIKRRSEQDDLD